MTALHQRGCGRLMRLPSGSTTVEAPIEISRVSAPEGPNHDLRRDHSMLSYLETNPIARSWADAANLSRPRRRPRSPCSSTFSPMFLFGHCRQIEGHIFTTVCVPRTCVNHGREMTVPAFAAKPASWGGRKRPEKRTCQKCPLNCPQIKNQKFWP